MKNKKIITTIAPTKSISSTNAASLPHRRAAAYARVSTSSSEQLESVEAQKDYYTKLINNRPDLIFVGLYADEGISGLSRENRIEFNRMMEDAVNGKIDLIITKSISRFARNTVDTLQCVRKLKEANVEVYFEKENIYTFDSKGELLLTLLSSLAQEESRSISENVTWGIRKRFSDGKYGMAYARFLGYEKGNDGELKVVAEQAAIVRLIYRLFIYGTAPSRIAKILMETGVPSPGGKSKWCATTICSILRNEKYKGDALLQKNYTVDYLTKKTKKNEGEIPRYYIRYDHEAIIPRATFDYVQTLFDDHHQKGSALLGRKIKCGLCGDSYCERRYKAQRTPFKIYWLCESLHKRGDQRCHGSLRFHAFDGAMACKEALNILSKEYPDILELVITEIKRIVGKKSSTEYLINDICYELEDTTFNDYVAYEEAMITILDCATVFPDYTLLFRFIDGKTCEVNLPRPQKTKKKSTKVHMSVCLYCGKTFGHYRYEERKYCSQACFIQHRFYSSKKND